MKNTIKITKRNGKIEMYNSIEEAKRAYDYKAMNAFDKRITDQTEEDQENIEISIKINNMFQEQLTLNEQHMRVW